MVCLNSLPQRERAPAPPDTIVNSHHLAIEERRGFGEEKEREREREIG